MFNELLNTFLPPQADPTRTLAACTEPSLPSNNSRTLQNFQNLFLAYSFL